MPPKYRSYWKAAAARGVAGSACRPADTSRQVPTMAPDKAATLPDTMPLSDTLERVPDSSPMRVSTNTLLESGIPPARLHHELSLDEGVEQLESALANVTRTEANLGLLVRGLKHLTNGALAAREANTELVHELDALRDHLACAHEEEQALRFRSGQLEQLLDVIRHETTRERQFLIEQQDLFLVEILSDHDRQVADLRRQLSERRDTQEIAELKAQRDQAREYATRCERERDMAWHELATGQAGFEGAPPSLPAVTVRRHATPPPLPPEAFSTTTSKSGAQAIGSISLRAVQVPSSAIPDTERSSERPTTGYSLSGEDVAD